MEILFLPGMVKIKMPIFIILNYGIKTGIKRGFSKVETMGFIPIS